MKTYTIEQIRKYITSQDSLGDVAYNLDRIDEILEKLKENEDEDEDEEFDGMVDWRETQTYN